MKYYLPETVINIIIDLIDENFKCNSNYHILTKNYRYYYSIPYFPFNNKLCSYCFNKKFIKINNNTCKYRSTGQHKINYEKIKLNNLYRVKKILLKL